MNITNILKKFFLPISTKLLQFSSKFYPQASSSSDALNPELPDLEARDDAVGVDPAEAARLVVVHRHHGQHHMDWTDVMIGFCLTSALEIALVSVQVHTQLSATFHLLSMAILFAFVCFSFSELMKSKFLVAAQLNYELYYSVLLDLTHLRRD
uniref:Uncharacterized protein n=1 Tax=Quercus lobata TaxID=97700 RepID=A0A7N2M753_QUELO